jgi:hypothetical protein
VPSFESIPGAELGGRSIFLSASFPAPDRDKRFHLEPKGYEAITDGVIALVRSVLAHGGVVVMGAHPTISPLVAQVAGEYRRAEAAKPPIIIYQSRVFERYLPESTLFLVHQGYASLVWTDVKDNEVFEPGRNLDKPPAEKSVQHMRERMFKETSPDAMVCMGGMEGVINEALLFHKLCPRKPIYTLATTGGAARLLKAEKKLKNHLREIDFEILRDLEKPRAQLRARLEAEGHAGKLESSGLYTLVMQTIVDELGRGAHEA